MSLFDQAQLKRAIAELKATTRVTMETVGVRFGRRVSTAVYRENLQRVPGEHAGRHRRCSSLCVRKRAPMRGPTGRALSCPPRGLARARMAAPGHSTCS